MIGIVVVSHSRKLAEAAAGLAGEMVAGGHGPVIAVAAGLDEATFGTDAAAVAEAIAAVDNPDGVLVLLDLGSAVMSAELALEFLDPEVAGRVRVSGAPLVEGLVAAVVTASTGATLEQVAAEAGRGLAAKRHQLGETTADQSQPPSRPGSARQPNPPGSGRSAAWAAGQSTAAGSGGSAAWAAGRSSVAGPAVGEVGESVEVVVSNRHGLHARPAARLVGLVNSFDAVVEVTDLETGSGPVNAGSISLVATLNAQEGHRLRFTATGEQTTEALAAIRQLAAEHFGDLTPEAGSQSARDGEAESNRSQQPGDSGRSSRAGSQRVGGNGLDVAMGPAEIVELAVDLAGYRAGDPVAEEGRLEDALAAVIAGLTRLQAGTDQATAAILQAQQALVDDPEQLTKVREAIRAGQSAVEAVDRVYGRLAGVFEALEDPYQRERAQDVRSVRDRLLRRLMGSSEPAVPADGSVLVVAELDAATAATVEAERIAGIAVRAADTTGHGVLVARSRGIPLIAGIGDVPIAAGQPVGFDERAGTFVVEPDEHVFRHLIEQRRTERAKAIEVAHQPATTLDGRTIPVMVNVGSVQDALDARGADGAGLVRTEVLFGDYQRPPSKAEQATAFRELAGALGGRPITIRTWDIGGDKPLPFLPQSPEPNPFLGERGLRVFHHTTVRGGAASGSGGAGARGGGASEDPLGAAGVGWERVELFREQLGAVREVGAETAVRVMFPMVTTAEEVGWALAELGARPAGLKVGIMVEIPAAALRISTLAAGLDFVSVGTNDLTQYATAADRTNSAVTGLADGLDPAVLRLIDHVVREVPAGVEVAVCGDLASDPDTAVLLAGLGVHELSATGPQVPLVKARLRTVDWAGARQLAAAALTRSSAAEVRALLREFIQ